MALDYFRSIPSRLQQKGLQGLAADQGEIDAEEQRRKEEEERAKQLEQIRTQFDAAHSPTTQDTQQINFRDDLLSQAKSRYEELTGHIGQGFSDLGGAAQTAAQGVGKAAGDFGEAVGQYGEQQEDLGQELQQRYSNAPRTVMSRVAEAAPSQQEVMGDLDAQAAATAGRRRREQENLQEQGPIGGTLANVGASLTGQNLSPEEEAERAHIAQTGGYGARAGRTLGSAVAGALGAEKPGEDVAQGAFKPTKQVKKLDAQGRWTGEMEEAPETEGGVAKVLRDVGEQTRTALGQGTRNENLLERGQAALGAGMNLAFGLPTEAVKGAVGRTTADPVSAEIAGQAAGILGPGGVGFKAVPEAIGAARTGMAGAQGARALAAGAGRGLLTKLPEAASAAGITGGALAGPVLGKKTYDEARAAGATHEEALARAVEAGAQPIQLGEMAGLGTSVARGGIRAVRALPSLPDAPRQALSRAGQITPDMSLGEGLRGAAQTGLAQGRAAVRGVGEDLAGALTRERGAAGRSATALGITPEGGAGGDVDAAALQAEAKALNQTKGKAAGALGKALGKAFRGDPNRVPEGLTPETQGIWDAYVEASRRTKEINDTLVRAKQSAAPPPADPLAGLAEPTGETPPNVPRQGRGSYAAPGEATINPPSFTRTAAKGIVAGQPEQYRVAPGEPGSVAPLGIAGQGDGQPPPFYSALQRAVTQLPDGKLSPAQLSKQLLAMPDVKREQLHWSGLDDYLAGKLQANNGKGEAVTKAELSQWLGDHDVRVYEIQKGSTADPAKQQELERVLGEAEQRSTAASDRLMVAERKGENDAWAVLGEIEARMRETEEGKLALDPTGQGYGFDLQGVAGNIVWGYPNAPKDRPFFDFLETEAIGRDPDDPYLKELTPEERQRSLAYNEPLLAYATPEERARLEAIRAEYQEASLNQHEAQQAYLAAENEAGDARASSLPGGPAKWVEYAGGGLYLPGADQPAANAREFLLTLGPRPDMPDYGGPHWDEPNIIAHVRMTDRVTPDGKRVLMIEELQSDWHQQARDIVKDDRGQDVVNPETGSKKRVGYYQGKRLTEEVRSSPEYAEAARLREIADAKSADYDAYTATGAVDQARDAHTEAEAGGIERAKQQLRDVGIPDEALPEITAGGWFGRKRTPQGDRIPDPHVLVRYAFPAETPRDKISTFGLVSRDAIEPVRIEILDWAPGYWRAGDPAAERSSQLGQTAREKNGEEVRHQQMVADRLQPGDLTYHYATRGAESLLTELAQVDPEVAPLRAAMKAEEARFVAVEQERSQAEAALRAHDRQYPDLRQPWVEDEIARLQAKVEQLRADPAVTKWQARDQALQKLNVETVRARREGSPPESDPGVQAAKDEFYRLNDDPAPPLTDTNNPSPEYTAWAQRMAEQEGARRELQHAESDLRGLLREQKTSETQHAYQYGGNKPPAGPFQKEGWQTLGLKRMLHLAAQEGYDYLGISTGDIQAQRYDPYRGMGISTLKYDAPNQTLTVQKGAYDQPAQETVPPAELHRYVGQAVADALLDPSRQQDGVSQLTKEDWEGGLAVENQAGAGLRRSYDEILPKLLTEQARRFGAEVRVAPETDPERALAQYQRDGTDSAVLLYPDKPPEEIVQERSEDGTVRERPNLQPAHLLQITPQMREAQATGEGMLPLFIQPGGGRAGDGSVGTDGTFGPNRNLDRLGEAGGAVAGGVRGYQQAEEEDERRRAAGEAGVSPFMKAASALFGAGAGATAGKMAVRGARVLPKLGQPGAARGAALLDFVRSSPFADTLGVGREGTGRKPGELGAVTHQDYAGQWLDLERSPARVLENRAATAEREAGDTKRQWQAFQRRVDKGIANKNERLEAAELADLFKKADDKAKTLRAEAATQRKLEDASLASLDKAGGARPKNLLPEGLEGIDPATGKPRKLGAVDRDALNQALLEYKVRGLSIDVAAARAGVKKADLIDIIDDLGIRRTNQQGGAILAERTGPPEEIGTPKPKVTMETLAAEDRAHAAAGDVWWREDLTDDEQEGLTAREIKKLRVERGLTPEGRYPKPKNPHVYVDLDGNTHYADSTYEAVVFRMLDELKQRGIVAHWQRGLVGDEAFAFNEAMLEQWRGLPVITKEGLTAAFAPDFFVVTRDPETGEFHMEVIEVKNTGIYARPEWRVPEKLAQGREFLEKNGVGYRLFTGDQIGRSFLASLRDSDLAPDAQGRMGMPDPKQRQALLGALKQDFGSIPQEQPRIRLGEWKNQTVPQPGAPPSKMDIPESRYPKGEEPAEEPLFPGEPAGLGRTFSERMGEQPGQTVHEILAEFNRKSAGAKLVPDASETLAQNLPRARQIIDTFNAKPKDDKGLTYDPFLDQDITDPSYPPEAAAAGPGGRKISVSIYPHAEVVFPGTDVHPVALAAWLSEHREILQNDPDVRVGLWYNKGKTYLDISTVVDSDAEAIALGKAMSQYKLFDVDNVQEMDLDYTDQGIAAGKRPPPPNKEEARDAYEASRLRRGAAGSGAAGPGGTLGAPGEPGGAVGGPGGAAGAGPGGPGAGVAAGLRPGDLAAPGAVADQAARPGDAGAPGPLGPAGGRAGLAGPGAGVGGPGGAGRVPADRPVLPTGAREPAPYRGRGVGGLAPEPSGRLLTGVTADLGRTYRDVAGRFGLPTDRLDTAAEAAGAVLGGVGEAGLEPGEDETPEERARRIAGGALRGGAAGLAARRGGAAVLRNLPELGRLARDEVGSAGALGVTATPPSTPRAKKAKAGVAEYADVKARMQAALDRGAGEDELAALEAEATTADPGERSFRETVSSGYKLGMLMTVRGVMRQVAGGVTVGAWQPGERALAGALASLPTSLGGSRSADAPRVGEAGAMLKATFNKANLSQAAAEAWASAAGRTTGAGGAGAEAIEAVGGKRAGEGFKGAANRFFDRGYQVFSVADTFFNRLASNAEMHAVAHRLASNGEGQGQTTSARVADLLANDERVHEAGATAAKYRTLQQDLDTYGKAVDGLRQIPGGEFVLPFWKTPYNAAKYDLERSPLGLAKTIVQAAKGGNKNISEAEKYERFARGIMGTTLVLGLYKAAVDGNLTGPEPRDQAERDQWRAEGRTPYSMRVGGRWVPVNQVPGLNATLSQVMNVYDYVNRRQRAGTWNPTDAKSYEGAVSALVMGTADNLVRRPFFDTAQSILEALEEGTGRAADDDDNAPSVAAGAGKIARSFIPAALREAERTTGTVDRAPRDVKEQILSGIPGASGLVPERRDSFGRPQVRVGSGSGEPLREILGGAERLANPMPGQQERPSPRRFVGTESIEDDAAVAALARRLAAYQKDPTHVPRPSDADLATLARHGTTSSGLYTETRRIARERAKQVGKKETPLPAYDQALAQLRAAGGGKGGGGLPVASPVARLLLAR